MSISRRIWLNFMLLVSGCLAADPGSDFSNNLFSDLAPLLALFGERVTMQFMSQSMGWADNFIIAMAPLGIITAVISAIRVGGPSWLKAIIGRARENLAVAEADLMSSTSKEVCELWNGQEVVRCMGSAPVVEFLCLLPPNMAEGRGGNGSTPPLDIKTTGLVTALNEGYLRKIDLNFQWNLAGLRRQWDGFRRAVGLPNEKLEEALPHPSPTELVVIRNTLADAPNISLNSHDQFWRSELRAAAIFGTLLQLGVVIYSGFATYYPTLRFKKENHTISGYAFPCTAVGTLVLVAGMLLCGHVVETSTNEERFQANGGRIARLVWLQKPKTPSNAGDTDDGNSLIIENQKAVPDMPHDQGPPYKITNKGTTYKHKQKFLALKTVLGAVITLSGFLVQFIGLRGMHWSVSISQLAAALIMAVVRALVRRGLAKPPQSKRLSPGFELEWFAITLGDLNSASWINGTSCSISPFKTWKVAAGEGSNIHKKLDEGWKDESISSCGMAHRGMMIRRDLGKLSGWFGPASTNAIQLARAIEIAMDVLVKRSRPRRYTWKLSVRYGEPEAQYVDIRLEREEEAWKIRAEELEATLSLWLYSARNHEAGQNRQGHGSGSLHELDLRKRLREKRSLRFLGLNAAALRRDLLWWIPSGGPTVFEVEPERSEREQYPGVSEVQTHRVVGCGPLCGLDSTHSPVFRYSSWSALTNHTNMYTLHKAGKYPKFLVAESDDPLESLYAQDMFMSFMWAAVKSPYTVMSDGTEIKFTNGLPSFRRNNITLRNVTLDKMAHDIQKTGLGSLCDIYLSIVPSLSVVKGLPGSDAFIKLGREHAKEYEQLGNWKEASVVYSWLFEIAGTFPQDGDIMARVTAMLTEYLRVITLAIELRSAQQYEEAHVAELKSVAKNLEQQLGKAHPKLMTSLMALYDKQGRRWKIDPALIALPFDSDDTFRPRLVQVPNITGYGLFELEKILQQDKQRINIRDTYDWTLLHYAAAQGSLEALVILLRHEPDPNALDLLGWTPLHYACQNGGILVASRLVGIGAEINRPGRDGIVPLHCACSNGHVHVVRLLLEGGAHLNIRDASGSTPLLLAVYNGHTDVVKYLWSEANTKLRDGMGRTTLHLAAISAKAKADMIKFLLEHGVTKDPKDRFGMTPLHYAAKLNHVDTVEELLEAGVHIITSNVDGSTPLHLAVEKSHLKIIRLLLSISNRGQSMEAQDNVGNTPLHVATIKTDADAVKLLFENGANEMMVKETDTISTPLIDRQNMAGNAPLHIATAQYSAKIVRLLIKNGANKNVQNNDKRTPLHLAVTSGDFEMVKLLIKMGADIEVKNSKGHTPLLLALWLGLKNIVEMLIERGADIEVEDSKGHTPLLLAVQRGHKNMVDLLIERGAELQAKDNDEYGPLALAVANDHVDLVSLFIEKYPDEETDYDGLLDLAAESENSNVEVAKILLEKGADKEARDNVNNTPLHIAAKKRRSDFITLFLDKGADKNVKNDEGKTPLCVWSGTGRRMLLSCSNDWNYD